MALFALPFFIAGLTVMFGFGTKSIRLNTYYAVTNERCIIISDHKGISICDYRYSAMEGINLTNGSIILSPTVYNIQRYSGRRNSVNVSAENMSIKNNFIDIGEDAPKVYKMITAHINEYQNANK